MKKGFLLVFAFVFLIGLVFASDYVPGEILVKYSDSIISTASVSEIKVLDVTEDYILLNVGEDVDIESFAEELESYDNVVYAEPNYIYHISDYPNDALVDSQWYLSNVNMTESWYITKGSEDVVIAIIDTGIDLDHEDLVNKLWNDSEGYHGYDFVNSNYLPDDDNGHGTHCAGIAAAETNNSLGVAGVCPNCKIMVIKALNSEGVSNSNIIAQGITYARNNNATIISMSFSGDSDDETLNDALQLAYNAGIILVAAAGNDGVNEMNYPAAYDIVISVGATDSNNDRSIFPSGGSNWGPWVDLFAPGSSILNTYIESLGRFSLNYESLSGTSMSTPLVAGAIGLIKSLKPNLNQTEIINYLENNSLNISTDVGYVSKINVFATLDDIDYLLLEQTSPSNGSYTNIANTNFTCVANSSVYNLTNITFFFYNSTGLVYNVTNSISGLDNSSKANSTFSSDGTYLWNCEAFNENSASAISENWTITYDGTLPRILNLSNETLFSTIDIYFEVSELVNYSLDYTDGMNDSYYFSNSSSIHLGNLNSSTKYEMNLTFCDRAGNCNFTEFNLTTLTIFVNLTSPPADDYTNINETNFTCEVNSTDSANLTNVTFFVYNSSNDLIYNASELLDGFYNSSVFNYTLEDESNYTWTCVAYNNASEMYSPSNYTISYDITSPGITIVNPTTSTDLLSVVSTEPMNYSISGSITNSSSNYTSSLSIPFDVSCGSAYSYSLVYCDRAGNCNTNLQSFITSACLSTSSGGGGGGGGGSSTIIGTYSNPALLNETNPSFEKEYSVNGVSYFELKGEKHSVTLSQIVNSVAIIIIKSEPIYIYLSENSSTMVDVDGVKGFDLEVIVGAISDNSAEITIQKIIETPAPSVEDKLNDTGNVGEGDSSNVESNKTLQWIYWVIGAIVLIGLIYSLLHNKVMLHLHELRLNKLHTETSE